MESPSVKLIKGSKLDQDVFRTYRALRKIFQKYGFTEDELDTVSHAPTEVWEYHSLLRNLIEMIKNECNKYGFDNQGLMDVDVAKYIENGLEKIDSETSLEGNKGYYNNSTRTSIFESTGFNKIESLIKDKLNQDAFSNNYVEDNTMYWDGETDVNESVNAIWQVDDVQMIPSEKEGCDLTVHMVISPISEHSFVFYEDMGEDFNVHKEPHSVRLRYFQDASWIVDRVEKSVKKRMSRYFPFPETCIKLYIE
jgi:hypothetical protein